MPRFCSLFSIVWLLKVMKVGIFLFGEKICHMVWTDNQGLLSAFFLSFLLNYDRWQYYFIEDGFLSVVFLTSLLDDGTVL